MGIRSENNLHFSNEKCFLHKTIMYSTAAGGISPSCLTLNLFVMIDLTGNGLILCHMIMAKLMFILK